MEQPNKPQDSTYFATRQGKELGQAIFEKKSAYERFVQAAGLQRVWRAMHWRYFGADPEGSWTDHEIGRDGPEGEIHLLMMNHLRADVTLWLNLASGSRTAMTPKAAADDYSAEIEVKRAKAALSYTNRTCNVETREDEAVEYAGVYGLGYVMRWWNTKRGEDLAPPAPAAGDETGMPPVEGESFKAGRMEVYATTPMDTFVDPLSRSTESPWKIVRLYQNRYDLAVDHQELASQLLAVASDDAIDGKSTLPVDLFSMARVGEGKQFRDEIPVYYFFHEDTPAVPGGRVVKLVTPDIILEDFKLTDVYAEIPVKRLACAEFHRTPFGFTPAWGLMAPQEAQQSLSTIGLTNARTFGFGTIIAPKGADVDETDLGDGLKLVEYTPGLEAPRALQMPATPQEVYAFRTALISEMGTLIGVNSVVRGDPEASLKSGSALALVQAQAVQFSNDFQKNIKIWKEKHHFDTISILQMNMQVELLPELAGDYEATLLKGFTGEDFKSIKKVEMEDVNPLSKTLAGKVQIADTLVERFANQLTPGDYMRVLETGNIDYLTRGETQRRRNLDRENELLAAGIGPVPDEPVLGPDGQPVLDPATGQPAMQPGQPKPGMRYVRALITDDHRAHVLKHLEVLDNPAIRESSDPEAEQVKDAALSHIEEHEKQAVQATLTRLTLLELTNQPPLQSALPPPPPGEGAPGEGGGPPKQGGGGSPPKPKSPGSAPAAMQPTPAGASQQPRQPQMPVNPATNQRVEPPGPP